MLNDYLSTPLLAGFPPEGKSFLFAGVRIKNGWSYLGAAAFVVALGLLERLLSFAYKDIQLSASSPSRAKMGRSLLQGPQRGLLHRRSGSATSLNLGGGRSSSDVSGIPKWQRSSASAAPSRLSIPLRRTSSVSFGPDPIVVLGSHGATDHGSGVTRRRFRSAIARYRGQRPLPLGISPRPTATLRRRMACLTLHAASMASRHLLIMIGVMQMDWFLLLLMVFTSAAGQLLVELLSEATERNYDPTSAHVEEALFDMEDQRDYRAQHDGRQDHLDVDETKDDGERELDDDDHHSRDMGVHPRPAPHDSMTSTSSMDEELEMQEAGTERTGIRGVQSLHHHRLHSYNDDADAEHGRG